MTVHITCRNLSTTTIMTVRGAIAAAEIVEWREALESAARRRPGPVLIDLSGLANWTAGAQEALIRYTHEMRSQGRWLAVCGLSGAALEAAGRVGLDRLVPVFADAAWAALGEAGGERAARPAARVAPARAGSTARRTATAGSGSSRSAGSGRAGS